MSKPKLLSLEDIQNFIKNEMNKYLELKGN